MSGRIKIVPRKYGRRYPWRQWFSKKRFTIFRGTDFAGRAYSMAQQVRTAARPGRWGVKVSIRISEDEESVTVVVHNPVSPDGPNTITQAEREARVRKERRA
jgi:hypothetical protein